MSSPPRTARTGSPPLLPPPPGPGYLDDERPLENETFRADMFFEEEEEPPLGWPSPQPPPPPPEPQPQRGLAPCNGHGRPPHRAPTSRSVPSRDRPPPPPPPAPGTTTTAVPLRQFARIEARAAASSPRRNRRSLVRKTAVAYALAELLRRLLPKPTTARGGVDGKGGGDGKGGAAEEDPRAICRLDNFVVRLSGESPDATVAGVDARAPPLAAAIVAPFFLSNEFLGGGGADGEEEEELGQFLEVEVRGGGATAAADSNESSDPTTQWAHAGAASNESSDPTTHWDGDGDDGEGTDDAAAPLDGSDYIENVLLRDSSSSPDPVRKGATFSDLLRFCDEDDDGAEREAAAAPLVPDDAMGTLGAPAPSNAPSPNDGEIALCHALGALLYELYSERPPVADFASTGGDAAAAGGGTALLDPNDEDEPRREKTTTTAHTNESSIGDVGGGDKGTARDDKVPGEGLASKNKSACPPLKELGFPASISRLVSDLLECRYENDFRSDDALTSLKGASDDLHLMLREPDRFLFDRIPERGGGAAALDARPNKLYGRDGERTLVTDVFCRISMTGESEALFIEGYSGSGKSRLVQSVVEYVDVSGAYIVQQKFGQMAQERSMVVVLSAFDELCTLIGKKRSPAELSAIAMELMAVFGNNLSTLARVLPKVALFGPQLGSATNDGAEINLNRVCFILQLFLRVVSSREHPVVLFLDDVHWADAASLDLVRYILADVKGSSCVYFIGSYRSNEVLRDHAIFQLMASLEECNINLSKIRLDGMGIDDVNHLLSDALGTFPRICRPLSRIVVRKTEGNPLFVLECLRSLADRDLLHYSLRERRWVWDVDKIGADTIEDDVCELLSAKMSHLSESSQLALKVASCFGNVVASQVVDILMTASPRFASLEAELDKAVDEGFMSKGNSGYRFAHDKVREAAYSLLENKKQFHHNLGMCLYYSTLGQSNAEQSLDSMIFDIVDQINCGDIPDPALRVTIAELNHRAASKAKGNSNFAAAFLYAKAGVNLLPDDHWASHYELSRGVFLVLGNAAYTEGHIEEAMSALDQILTHGKTLADKLDAYYLKVSLLHARKEAKLAYDMCVEVIEQLGETVPTTIAPERFLKTSEMLQNKLNAMTEEQWMSMEEMRSPLQRSLMQFYSQICVIAYFVNRPMIKWYARRLVELSLERGVCKHSPLGMMNFALVLEGPLFRDHRLGEMALNLSKTALKLMGRFDDATDLIPNMYLLYYGYITVHVEPLQSCAAMMKRGNEIGLSTGDIHTAAMNGMHYIQKSLNCGMNLVALAKECEYQIRIIDEHSLPLMKMYFTQMRETIAVLTTKRGDSSPASITDSEEDNVSKVKEFSESILYHRVFRSFWLGHYERCLYHADRSSPMSDDLSEYKTLMIINYSGLVSVACRKYKATTKLVRTAQQAIDVMKAFAQKNPWNYLNKVYLLEAQLASATDCGDQARASFNAAISAARSSKFVHEEGLACEFAAFHCVKYGEARDAKELFKQAKGCYEKWGAQMKVEYIERQLATLGESL